MKKIAIQIPVADTRSLTETDASLLLEKIRKQYAKIDSIQIMSRDGLDTLIILLHEAKNAPRVDETKILAMYRAHRSPVEITVADKLAELTTKTQKRDWFLDFLMEKHGDIVVEKNHFAENGAMTVEKLPARRRPRPRQ